MTAAKDTSRVYREVNEQTRRLSGSFGLGREDNVQIVCECTRGTCAEAIEMTIGEYDELRATLGRSAIRPGHPFPEADRRQSTTARYWIVAPRSEALEGLTGA